MNEEATNSISRFALTMKEVNGILSKKIPFLYVVEPQRYKKVSKLNLSHYMFPKDEERKTYFYNYKRHAVSGSGADEWYVISPAFLQKISQNHFMPPRKSRKKRSRKSRKRRPSRKSRKRRPSRKSRKRRPSRKSRKRRPSRKSRKKSRKRSKRKRSRRKKSRSRRKSRRTKKKSQKNIRKIKAIYYNKKKVPYFEMHKMSGNKWNLHLEFPNFDIKTYFVKIDKEKFARPSFPYKVKQSDYIEEYKSMIRELGYITPQEKMKLKKECNKELQRIKRGITLTFKQ